MIELKSVFEIEFKLFSSRYCFVIPSNTCSHIPEILDPLDISNEDLMIDSGA